MNRWRILLILASAALAACGDDRRQPDEAPLPADSIPGVYAGVVPCEDCPGIDTTLWLRADGRYFLSQHYRAGDGVAAYEAHSLGTWQPTDASNTLALSGGGPERLLHRADADRLHLLSHYDPDPVLERDDAARDFSADINLDGVLRVAGKQALYTDCRTGLNAPLAGGGELRALLHRYRAAVGAGESAAVRLNGHFTWHEDGSARSLVVTRVISLSPDGRCGADRP